MKPSFHILPSSISLSFDGKVLSIPKGDRRHGKLIDAIREGRYDDIPAIVEDLDRYFAKHDGVEFIDGKVLIDGQEVSSELNHYILGLAEECIPFDRMVAFWRRLMASGRYGSKQRLFTFLQRNEHPIAEDGRFLAYRRVFKTHNERTADGNLPFPEKEEGVRILVDYHSKTIDNSVGEVPSMNPSDVCDDPNITCAAGLHAASFGYANDFYHNGILVEVAIAPEDVICVPVDYNGEKMRTCKYEVIAEIDGPRTGSAVDLVVNFVAEPSENTLPDEDDDYCDYSDCR